MGCKRVFLLNNSCGRDDGNRTGHGYDYCEEEKGTMNICPNFSVAVECQEYGYIGGWAPYYSQNAFMEFNSLSILSFTIFIIVANKGVHLLNVIFIHHDKR